MYPSAFLTYSGEVATAGLYFAWQAASYVRFCAFWSEVSGLYTISDMRIARAETPDVLGTSLRSDLRWDDHVFNVSKVAAKILGFLKRCKKYFTPSDLRTVYVIDIRSKMEYNSHLWADVCAFHFVDRIQSRALKLIGPDRFASSITSLGHNRNVSCIVFFFFLVSLIPTGT